MSVAKLLKLFRISKKSRDDTTAQSLGQSIEGVSTSSSRKSKTIKVIVLVAVLVILTAVGGGIYTWRHSQHQEESTTAFPQQNVELKQLDFAALQAKTNELELSKQYDQARELVKFQDYYTNNQDARLLYTALCINQGDHEAALEEYRSIETIFGESPATAAGIAEQAVATGDTKLATTYYKKAIKLTEKDTSNPVRSADVKLYKEQLKELEE